MAVNLNETATLKLRADGKDVSNELGLLDTKAKELRKTLKEIEQNGGKGSENWKKYRQELKEVQTETAKLKKDVDVTTLTYGQLQNRIKDLNKELKSLKPGTEEFIKAAKNLGQAEAQFKKVGKEVDDLKKGGEDLGKPTLWQKITSGVVTVQKAMQAFIALQIVGFIVDIGKAIFETTAKFEKYEKVLTTAFGGNVKLARESMAALKELGASTAFSVDELTNGYVKLVNRGLRPSKSEMVALTDLAASQGKTFDQLVEGLLDAATGEFERLKEFGTRASKAGEEVSFKFKDAQLVIKNTGEGFEVLDKATGKVVNTFKSQEDATLGVLTALGSMKGVGGQNAEMMETLAGKSSNLGDSFDALMVELGTGLRPVFIAILDLISRSIPALSLLGKAIGTALLISKSLIVGVAETVTNTGQMLFNFTKAAIELASGNVEGAKKTWDQTKAYGKAALTSMGENIKVGVTQIVNTWKDPNAGIAAQFAGKDQGGKFQKELTKEQEKAIKDREKAAEKARKEAEKAEQKHLEEVRKANEKALEELAKIEAEAHLNSIKDEMQREFVKAMQKRDKQAEEILNSLASEDNKNKQIAALDKKLEAEITSIAEEFGEKRRKKAEELEIKRLEAEKNVIEQQRQAESALLDWRELMAKGNAAKLTAIHTERSNSQYRLTVDKLNAEESAEKAKATREITDKEQLRRTLDAIENRYDNERQLAEKRHADEIDKINKELQEKKKARWTDASNAFSSLLKGDLNGFVEHASKLVEGEKSAWQKRLAENEQKYAAVGAMANAAVQFLVGLEKQKAERAIAEAKRERDEKVKLLTDQIALEQAAQDAAEAQKQLVTQQSNDKIQAIKDASEKTISDLESQYRQLSSTEEKKKLEEQISGYKENAEGKKATVKEATEAAIEANNEEARQAIEAAQKAEKAAITAAQNTKTERIDAAEAARDAEIAAIEKRKDIDQATRKQLLKEAQDKFTEEKRLAEEEATVKINQAKQTADKQAELAKATAKTKNELAKDNEEAELKAIEAIQNGDEKAAKEILARAKEDAREKIRLAKEEAEKAIEEAEREKREKLKKVEQEKQQRIQNKKELERAIAAEDAKAKATEAAAKKKAWEAQKKADIAAALIAGALATIKALASGFFPLNLVFAATTAVMTGIQVAMIKSQPAPQFAKGGFIPRGGRHGSSYGEGGISLIDRETGREVGEMEGDEAIISREQTAANLPLIERMFANARNPSRRNQPVTSDRPPVGYRDGGLFSSPYWEKGMYLFGSKKAKRQAEQAQRDAEAAAREAAADAAAATASYSYEGADAGGLEGGADAEGAFMMAQEQGEEQLRLLAKIEEAVTLSDTHTTDALKVLSSDLSRALSSLSLQIKLGFELLSADQKASLEKVSADLSQMLGLVSEEIVEALDGTSRDNGRGLEELSAQQKSSFALLNTNVTKGFIKLGTDTGKGFEDMSKDVVKAIETQSTDAAEQSEKQHQELTKQLEEFSADLVKAIETQSTDAAEQSEKQHQELTKQLEEFSADLVKAIETQSTDSTDQSEKQHQELTKQLEEQHQELTKQLGEQSTDAAELLEKQFEETLKVLDTLNKDLVTALEELSDETAKSLDTLDKDLVTALETLAKETDQNLEDLSTETTFALETLSTNTTQGLNNLATETKQGLSEMAYQVGGLRGSINAVEGAVRGVEGATRGVEGAVYGTNQAGKLDQLISAISSFGGK